VPTNYENLALLDEVLTLAPLDRLYDEVDKGHQALLAQAVSLETKPKWEYQDCLIIAVMRYALTESCCSIFLRYDFLMIWLSWPHRWFKDDFFQWVNNPPCSQCSRPTIGHGTTPLTPDESAGGAVSVELYRCSSPDCDTFGRFPRYRDVWKLLQTRRGRIALLCFAGHSVPG
jgi:peptide-N4-(N-acetyl-beta-glucosaminyl)asparagine amidase